MFLFSFDAGFEFDSRLLTVGCDSCIAVVGYKY
jgi:hypothetical protein